MKINFLTAITLLGSAIHFVFPLQASAKDPERLKCNAEYFVVENDDLRYSAQKETKITSNASALILDKDVPFTVVVSYLNGFSTAIATDKETNVTIAIPPGKFPGVRPFQFYFSFDKRKSSLRVYCIVE